MSLSQSQSVVHVMASLQPWFSMQSIVGAALITNPCVFVTYNSGSLSQDKRRSSLQRAKMIYYVTLSPRGS